jgi:tetratricopeptide (TPR) repeat protein
MRGLALYAGFCVAAFGMSAAMASGISAPPPPQDIAAERALLAQGIAEAGDNGTPQSIADLKRVLASPVFEQLSGEERHQVYGLLGAELQIAKDPAALEILKHATQSEYTQGFDWAERLFAAAQQGDDDECINSLTVIAQRWPDSLSLIADQGIFRFARLASIKSDDAAITLLGPLHDAHWKPKGTFTEADSLWFDLAVAHLNRGQAAAAALAMNDVANPALIVTARIDKRFDEVVALNVSHFDVQSAIAHSLERDKTRAAAAPTKLEGITNMAEDLTALGHPEEALNILDPAIAKATPSGSAPSPFDDYGDKMIWALNARARTLFALGRHDEGIEAYKQAAQIQEYKNPNVSQTINLSIAYTRVGRPNDALDVLATLKGPTSPVGKSIAAISRACAYAELGDASNLNQQLDYLKAHSAENPMAMVDALLCTKNEDALATEVLAKLRDTATRSTMLYELQDFLPSPHETATDREQRLRLIAVRTRADVAAEIDKVGRIQSWPLVSPLH